MRRNLKNSNLTRLTRLMSSLSISFLALGGCKPAQQAKTASQTEDANSRTAPVASPTPRTEEQSAQEKLKVAPYRTGLTATEWLTKKNISDAEAKTVDALLDSIESFGGPSGNPTAAARWAEGRMQVAFLADYGLTEISPILPFKRIVTLYVTGNKLTQEQFNALLENLPNLKTIVKDPYIVCDSIAFPKVTCLD